MVQGTSKLVVMVEVLLLLVAIVRDQVADIRLLGGVVAVAVLLVEDI